MQRVETRDENGAELLQTAKAAAEAMAKKAARE